MHLDSNEGMNENRAIKITNRQCSYGVVDNLALWT